MDFQNHLNSEHKFWFNHFMPRMIFVESMYMIHFKLNNFLISKQIFIKNTYKQSTTYETTFHNLSWSGFSFSNFNHKEISQTASDVTKLVLCESWPQIKMIQNHNNNKKPI